MKNTRLIKLFSLLFALCFLFCACSEPTPSQNASSLGSSSEITDELPVFSDSPFTVLNNNIPLFVDDEITTDSFEEYSELDSLGRCGVAFASIGVDLMPTEDRGAIGQVKPSGWHTVKYDIVDGKYLYNRCHLIGFQLSGENANEQNLITGTRYFNVEGMLPFENMVADYVKETENHVMFRVTPIYEGNNLVASGVTMEAYSVEDEGEGICFNVFVYNVQPGIVIDYATGNSAPSSEELPENSSVASSSEQSNYILNTNSLKFHSPSCSSVEKIKSENKDTFSGTRDSLIDDGYSPCGICKP